MKIYEVGGCVRDEILGVPSKDIDFTVVLDESDAPNAHHGEKSLADFNVFYVMVEKLEKMGFKIFLETPEFLTVRAQFPKDTAAFGNIVNGQRLTADFVLARKEGEYADGRRPDTVTPGTLDDDLARRDFTMNAIAKDHTGSYIDPFNGREDIAKRIIRTVGDPYDRLSEDALRAVRALRFAVTKDFAIEPVLRQTLLMETDIHDAIRNKISDERIAVELQKMFRFDTVKSLRVLSHYPALTDAMFAGGVSLDATMKQRGRGK